MPLAPIFLLVLAGCGNGAEPGTGESPPAAPAERAERAEQVSPESAAGHLTFVLSGEPRRFDYLPGDRNTFSRYGSTVTAKPSASAKEILSITFLSIDLGELEYPATLPPTKDLSQPISASLAMASVGFSYIDDAGNEWAGPGALRLESFEDGLLSGSFDRASIPHTDKTLPDIELAEGSFSVQLR